MDFTKLQDFVKKKKSALANRQKALQLKAGPNRLVILPGWKKEDRETFLQAFGAHYVKNAAGETTAFFPCSDKIDGTPCPVCEALGKAAKIATSPEALELLEQAGSSQRFLFNVLALDSDAPNTPQVLDVPKTVALQLIGMMEDWGTEIFNETAPQIVTVEKSGTGKLTKYTTQVSPKKHSMPAGVMDALVNLEEYVRDDSEEKMKRAISSINNVAGLIGTSTIAPASSSAGRLSGPVSRDVPQVDKPSMKATDVVDVEAKSVTSAPSIDAELDDLVNGIDLDDDLAA